MEMNAPKTVVTGGEWSIIYLFFFIFGMIWNVVLLALCCLFAACDLNADLELEGVEWMPLTTFPINYVPNNSPTNQEVISFTLECV